VDNNTVAVPVAAKTGCATPLKFIGSVLVDMMFTLPMLEEPVDKDTD
jgi:hypothetical protein